ncbi:MAG TPA: hypothetical protein VH165_27800 [Kofleriaceae bacterium]|jgi:hypothetical protein|nr:hypothetical protein [Kofleriaceae bacterium]
MATRYTDDDDSPVPEPETEPSPAELAHARRFAEVVDKTLLGRIPPAMSADDRALLEVATVIRATHGSVELAPGTRRSIVEDALRQAVGAAPPSYSVVVPIERSRSRRWAPWLVAGTSSAVAAAAIAMLWLRPLAPAAQSARRVELPEDQRSRPADALIGPIARDHAGDASARIDTIFADRLDGFRARRMARGGKP